LSLLRAVRSGQPDHPAEGHRAGQGAVPVPRPQLPGPQLEHALLDPRGQRTGRGPRQGRPGRREAVPRPALREPAAGEQCRPDQSVTRPADRLLTPSGRTGTLARMVDASPASPYADFVAGLPKAELHVHHVGSASPRIVSELAARHPGTVPSDLDALREFYTF